MEQTIILSIAALIAAGIALAINLHYLLARHNARLKILLGERMTFSYSPENQLRFSTSVAVTNEGSNVRTIVKLHGTITAQTGESARFVWRNFISNGSGGNEHKPHYSFSGWANAIAVPARSAKVSEVLFSTVEAFQLKEGTHVIEFVVIGERQNKELMRLSQLVRCSKKNVEYINQQRNGEIFDSAERALRAKSNLAHRIESAAIPGQSNATKTPPANGIETPLPYGTDTHVMCSKCGNVNDANRGYCAGCGNEFPREARPCPGCRRSLPMDEKFCGACGTRVAFAFR